MTSKKEQQKQKFIERRLEFINDCFPLFFEYINKIKNNLKYWENEHVLEQINQARICLGSSGKHDPNYPLYLIDFHTKKRILIHDGEKRLADGNHYFISPYGRQGIISPEGEVLQ